VLLINPRSGGGTAERVGLAGECRARGVEPVVLGPGEDVVALAEAAVAGGAEVIGMAGGDGSLALVAGVAARHRVPMVVVPAGTRNHLAMDLSDVARMMHGDLGTHLRSRAFARLVLVVIFSRRGFIPAGPSTRAQGTLSRLASWCSVWLPWARREEVAAPGALPADL
jgi:hypothetical protein